MVYLLQLKEQYINGTTKNRHTYQATKEDPGSIIQAQYPKKLSLVIERIIYNVSFTTSNLHRQEAAARSPG